MIQIEKPQVRTFWKITSTDGNIVHSGWTDPDQVTTSGQDVLQTDSAITPDGLPELPTEGEIDQRMYSFKGKVVICHKPHNRTIYDPKDTPALFTFFRTNSDDLEWIPNEKVDTGWKRMYDGVQYEVIQAHMTLDGWEPNNTPALWQEVLGDEVAEWVQPTSGHDAYNIGDKVKFEGNTWESLIDANVTVPDGDVPWNRYWKPL